MISRKTNIQSFTIRKVTKIQQRKKVRNFLQITYGKYKVKRNTDRDRNLYRHTKLKTNNVKEREAIKYAKKRAVIVLQTKKRTYIRKDRHTNGLTGRQTYTQTDKQTYIHKDRHTDRQKDRQTGRQTDIQTKTCRQI